MSYNDTTVPQTTSPFKKKLHWKNRFRQLCNWLSFYDDGLSFISVNLSEREFLKPLQRAPLSSDFLPRYFPFRLEWWHLPYHQAPVYRTAQLLLHLSLSLSFVVNAFLLCSEINESPAVPEYEPTSSRYFACSSPTLNLPYLAYTLTPFQSSSSTRRALGLAAVNLWILSFPNQNSAVSWPKPDF